MKKRIISLLLCLVMVVSLLPVTAHADSVQEDMTKYAGKCITKIELEASVDHAYAPHGCCQRQLYRIAGDHGGRTGEKFGGKKHRP